MLIQVDGRRIASSPPYVGLRIWAVLRGKGTEDSGIAGKGVVVCRVLAAAVAQLLLQRVRFSRQQNAFDINTSVHSFHLSCVIEVLGLWFLVPGTWYSVPGCFCIECSGIGTNCLRKLMVRTCP